MNRSLNRVAGGVRIPFCRNNIAYADVDNFGDASFLLRRPVSSISAQAASRARLREASAVWRLWRDASTIFVDSGAQWGASSSRRAVSKPAIA